VRRAHGLTLVELLISIAILGSILGVLSALFLSTNRAYERNQALSEAQQTVETTTQLLSYELALAGYRGVDVTAPGFTSRNFGGQDPVVVSPDRQRITVRYYEDRFVGCPRLTEATFAVRTSAKALTRDVRTFECGERYNPNKTSSGAQQVVLGVTKLEVLTHSATGIQVKITFEGGSQRVIPVAFHNALMQAAQ
jgi:prepilin-type N-terminal cleavage/methylation domain-containing protein